MSKSSSLSVSATLPEMVDAWKEYRGLPEDTRERVAQVMFGDEDFTMAGLNRKLGKIIIEILRGNIPPGVDNQVQAWFDRLMLNIHTMHVQQGTEKQSGRDIAGVVVNILQEASQKPSIQYLTAPAPRLIEPVELPLLEDDEELEAITGGQR